MEFFRAGCVTIIALSLTGLGACEDSSVEEVRSHLEEGWVQAADGVELYFRVVGSGRDTIVVLHGGAMGLSLDYLAPDLEPLAGAHTLVFYDQRGAGRSTLVSDPERMQVDRHVADLEAVRQHFSIDRMTLLGHSWGAGLAALYATQHPQRVSRLVLVGPMMIRNTPYTEEFSRNLTGWMDEATLAEFENRAQAMAAIEDGADPRGACQEFWEIFARGYFGDPHDTTALDRMRGDLCAGPEEALRNSQIALALTYESLGNWDWRTHFDHVDAPVLLIVGEMEPIPMGSAQEWLHAFSDAQLVVLDDVGHYPHVEEPDEFFSAVEGFLR